MELLVIFLILILIVVIAAAVEIHRELHHFCVTEYTVSCPKLTGLRDDATLVFLSDLHNCTYGHDNASLLQAVRNAGADLILIGGDMLVGKEDTDFQPALDLVKQLPQIAPVYYALGNHEGRMKEEPEDYGHAYEHFKAAAEEAGVHFLENETARINCRGKDIDISGLELPVRTYRKFRKAAVTPETVADCLRRQENPARGPFRILLAHNPAYMDAYLGWGADLVLSGHLHGGLVRIPGLGGIVTPQGFLFPKYSGEMTREGDRTVIVSRGLGTHTLNIRLFNMPELIVIRLKKTL